MIVAILKFTFFTKISVFQYAKSVGAKSQKRILNGKKPVFIVSATTDIISYFEQIVIEDKLVERMPSWL
ncbi:MAG: hypothetical protein CW716_04930 [Candidatus Bathyarchaeum sp.]|nr:MAG: hypothetical protein CW716_04930 [Candidatus Bathyarchaeum sp.]